MSKSIQLSKDDFMPPSISFGSQRSRTSLPLLQNKPSMSIAKSPKGTRKSKDIKTPSEKLRELKKNRSRSPTMSGRILDEDLRSKSNPKTRNDVDERVFGVNASRELTRNRSMPRSRSNLNLLGNKDEFLDEDSIKNTSSNIPLLSKLKQNYLAQEKKNLNTSTLNQDFSSNLITDEMLAELLPIENQDLPSPREEISSMQTISDQQILDDMMSKLHQTSNKLRAEGYPEEDIPDIDRTEFSPLEQELIVDTINELSGGDPEVAAELVDDFANYTYELVASNGLTDEFVKEMEDIAKKYSMYCDRITGECYELEEDFNTPKMDTNVKLYEVEIEVPKVIKPVKTGTVFSLFGDYGEPKFGYNENYFCMY